MQEPHQVAQNSITTTLPFSFSQSVEAPGGACKSFSSFMAGALFLATGAGSCLCGAALTLKMAATVHAAIVRTLVGHVRFCLIGVIAESPLFSRMLFRASGNIIH